MDRLVTNAEHGRAEGDRRGPRRRVLAAAVAALVAAGAVGGLAYSCAGSSGSGSPGSAPVSPGAVSATFPLTGLPSDGQARAGRPALSVKIDNAGPAHPQSGLNDADIVSEQLVEGGVTRLLAVYQSRDSAAVGPIRSARPVDAALLRQVGGGIFAFSGAAAGELAPVRAESHAVFLSNDQLGGSGGVFTRSPERRAPYNLYAATEDLYGAGYARGAARKPPPAVFSYSATPSPSATSAPRISMSFSPSATRSWKWDAKGGVWIRSENGRPDVLANGQPVSATNVVVMSVTARDIPGLVDTAGNNDQDIALIGSGPCWVLRNGVATTGRWTRESISDVGRIADSAGHPIPLMAGRTWIELLPRPHQPSLEK